MTITSHELEKSFVLQFVEAVTCMRIEKPTILQTIWISLYEEAIMMLKKLLII